MLRGACRLFLGAVVLAACQTSGGPEGPPEVSSDAADLAREARERGWDEQAEMLADGQVTKAEYEQAIDNTRACLDREGQGSSEPVLSPIDNLTLDFGSAVGTMSEDEAWAVSDSCHQRYLWSVEGYYLETHDAVMDADIRDAVVECMKRRGYAVPPSVENAKDIIGEVGRDKSDDLAQCISDEARRLRPELDSIGFSF